MAPALRKLWPDRRARTIDELSRDLSAALQMPGYQMAVSPPIRTRVDMLTTGVRTPVGVKVLGADLAQIERTCVELEGMLRDIPGTRSVFAERQTGREYLDITPNRAAIARYGLTVRNVQDVVENALGGMTVSTVIAGRARFSVNVRLAQDFRQTPESIRSIPVPVASSEATGGSATGMQPASAVAARGGTGSGGMGSMGSSAPAAQVGSMAGGNNDAALEDPARRAMQRAVVPLGQLADVRIVQGPPMIKDEDGVLVGYVFVDVDTSQRDLGGWVTEAKARVASRLTLPTGYRVVWTGQYEFMTQMEERMRYVLPITLALIVILLHMSMRGWQQTSLVLMSLPFAFVGSILLLAARGYNLSTAVWVGLVAVGGVAAETGTVMIVYLDEAIDRMLARIPTPSAGDIDAAIIEGASMRVRPLLMTVATTVLGLLPLMWESGVGADVSARTAAPVVGGMWSCMLLTLLVLPAIYTMWRRWQLRRGALRVDAPKEEPAETDATPSIDAAPAERSP